MFEELPDACSLTFARTELSSTKTGLRGKPLSARLLAMFRFSKKGFGFGEITLWSDPDTGRNYIDSECMSKETVKQILCSMVDGAVMHDDNREEYNEFTQKVV